VAHVGLEGARAIAQARGQRFGVLPAAAVVSPRARSKVPTREQWLAAGAALGNLLNAAHQLGFGAIVLSGERCFDPLLAAQLGVRPDEFLAGFISLGSVVEAPPPRRHPLPAQVWSSWMPAPGDRTGKEMQAAESAKPDLPDAQD
jgi:nitroreductase